MKLFKDLPNTDTPINAENLNQIQDNLVVVSPTEPTGDNREKVWMQKGKNLYNPQNAYVTGNLSQNIGLIYRDIKAGQTYTFSATNYSWVSVKTYNSANELIREVGNTEFSKEVTITIQDTEIYVELLFYTGLNNLTSTNNIDFTNVQLEQGSTATAYEEYIEPKIHVLNDNDVYEKFISKEDTLENYSTEETKIGTWIDRRYLYRKVITYNQYLNKDIVISIPHNIENLKTLVKISANMEWEGGFYPFPTHYENQQNEIVINSIDKTNINITSYGENWGAQIIYFILEYTKTTD